MAKGAIPAPAAWRKQIFSAQSVKNGGVVRRSVSDVKKFGGGIGPLKADVLAKGFHLLRTGDQYVILCHKGILKVIC